MPSESPPGSASSGPWSSSPSLFAVLVTALVVVIVVAIAALLYQCTCNATKAPLAAVAPPPKFAAAAAATPAIQFAWAQLVPHDPDCSGSDCGPVILLRAIVPRDASCEGLARSAKTNQFLRLVKRENQKPDRFPIEVCEGRFETEQDGANLADGSAVRWAGVASGPKTISIIGDTGCDDGSAQDCNAVRKWPLARIAADAAWLASDLVIHVGDYR